MKNKLFSVDVGATGTKAAIVDVKKGKLLTERIKYPTPDNAGPEDIARLIKQLMIDLDYQGKSMGIGFPSIIHSGVCKSAVNVSDRFIGVNLEDYFSQETSCRCFCVNDADAAGLAELHFGAVKNAQGTVLLLTLGTGIGSALFRDGVLVPNTEFGSLHYKDGITEHYAANSARKRKEQSWETWGNELNEVLQYFERIVSPDLIILGGGVSKKLDNYKSYLHTDATLIPAQHLNEAGVIGAGLYARMQLKKL